MAGQLAWHGESSWLIDLHDMVVGVHGLLACMNGGGNSWLVGLHDMVVGVHGWPVAYWTVNPGRNRVKTAFSSFKSTLVMTHQCPSHLHVHITHRDHRAHYRSHISPKHPRNKRSKWFSSPSHCEHRQILCFRHFTLFSFSSVYIFLTYSFRMRLKFSLMTLSGKSIWTVSSLW